MILSTVSSSTSRSTPLPGRDLAVLRVRLQRSVGILSGWLLASGCAGPLVLQSANGGLQAQAADSRLSLHADLAHWDGEPRDIGRFLTPVWVDLNNRGELPVRVTLTDFALATRQGFRHAPIQLDAWQPRNASTSAPIGPSASAPMVVGELVLTGGYPYTPYPLGRGWGWPYAPYGGYWGPPLRGYYWYPEAPVRVISTETLRRMALGEGTLAPGGQVSGFLYFSNSCKREPADLDLVWEPRSVDGAPLSPLTLALRVASE